MNKINILIAVSLIGMTVGGLYENTALALSSISMFWYGTIK